jgi:hypothetical protein
MGRSHSSAVEDWRKHLSEKEDAMPPRSKAQARAMFAAASGNSTIGIPKKVGQEFTGDLEPGSVKKLPQRLKAKKPKRSHRNGQISERAASRSKNYGGKDDMNIPGSTA